MPEISSDKTAISFPFHDLPPELQIKVLNHLPLTDRIKFGNCVSKTVRASYGVSIPEGVKRTVLEPRSAGKGFHHAYGSNRLPDFNLADETTSSSCLEPAIQNGEKQILSERQSIALRKKVYDSETAKRLKVAVDLFHIHLMPEADQPNLYRDVLQNNENVHLYCIDRNGLTMYSNRHESIINSFRMSFKYQKNFLSSNSDNNILESSHTVWRNPNRILQALEASEKVVEELTGDTG